MEKIGMNVKCSVIMYFDAHIRYWKENAPYLK